MVNLPQSVRDEEAFTPSRSLSTKASRRGLRLSLAERIGGKSLTYWQLILKARGIA
ncbi:MAG: hypothetical protein H0U75_02575 [Legionella sp.]|nr:hypothetical protein [Legionella sp.]